MRVDAHQHFWNLEKVRYPWLGPEHGVIYRSFEPAELLPQLLAAGVEKTVLVQSANSNEDTESMLQLAAGHDWIGGVVGWVPLLQPEAMEQRLLELAKYPVFKGVRHLIHDEVDPDWIIQQPVIESLRVLARHGFTYDLVAVFPNHLKHVPLLMEQVPGLKLVIDHLAKPPIHNKQWQPWAEQLAAAAACPDVYAKISGLNTAASPDWSAEDLKPYIDYAMQQFGADRLMFGSDWPVALLAGDYASVWEETNKALASYSEPERGAVFGGTAARFYRI